jgi:hypothetical protein
MATLVLMQAHASLGRLERTSLIAFLVVFPVIVLVTFTWLVVKHHTKLYGPGDYKNEVHFVQLNAEDQRRKLEEEIDETEALSASTRPDERASDAGRASTERPTPAHSVGTTAASDSVGAVETSASAERRRAQTRYLLAEDLVLRKLQGEWSTPINRGVRFQAPNGHTFVDGLAQVGDQTRIVEVRVMSSAVVAERAADVALTHLSKAASLMAPDRSVRGVLALVATREADAAKAKKRIDAFLARRKASLPFELETRVYSLPELAADFGVILPDELAEQRAG